MADIFREVTDIWPYRHPYQNPLTLLGAPAVYRTPKFKALQNKILS